MSKDRNNKKGFTLAEVLITLTIIGVVAALTIPSLLASVKDKTYESKRKGFATRMAQAVSQIGTITAYQAIPPVGNTDAEYAEKYSSMNFVTEALSKSLKITAMCEYDNYQACDFPAIVNRPQSGSPRNTVTYQKMSNLNSRWTSGNKTLNSYAAAFRTKNGESVLLWYNPKCVDAQDISPDTKQYTFQNEICINMWYDLDGSKSGPNTLGRDIGFMIVVNPSTPYLIANSSIYYLYGNNTTSEADGYKRASLNTAYSPQAQLRCFSTSTLSRRVGDWILPTRQELYPMAMNYALYGQNAFTWTSTVEGGEPTDYGWVVNPYNFTARKEIRTTKEHVTCLLR